LGRRFLLLRAGGRWSTRFAAYISRVYSEFGKILPREVQDNLDEWERRKVEPLIGLWTREEARGHCCAAGVAAS